MKNKHQQKITLKKLTITKITGIGMNQIKGGSSLPTRENPKSDLLCDESLIP